MLVGVGEVLLGAGSEGKRIEVMGEPVIFVVTIVAGESADKHVAVDDKAQAADDELGGLDEPVVRGLEVPVGWTLTGISCFSGVSGMKPLQNNLLPNCSLL